MRKLLATVLSALFLMLFICGSLVAQNNTPSDTTVYNVVDTKPVFPGDIYTYIEKNIHYPQAALDDGTEGVLYLSFVVDKTGQVRDVRVEHLHIPDLENEAIRVIKNMPIWTPGKINGIPVNALMHISVKFTLRNDNPNDTIFRLKRIFAGRRGFYLIPYLGGGIGKVETNVQFGIIGGGLGIGGTHFVPTGGADVSYMFNNHFGAVVGAELQEFTEHYKTTYYVPTNIPNVIINNNYPPQISYAIDVNYSFTFMHIPVMFKYVSGKPGNAGIYFETGILFGMPFYGSESGSVSQLETSYTTGVNLVSPNTVNFVSKSFLYNSDNGLILNVGVMIPFSDRYSLSVDFSNVYKFTGSVGNGKNDNVSFGNTIFNYYTGEYGQANAFLLDVKFLLRIGHIPAKVAN